MKSYKDINDLILISETALESSLAGFWDWNMVTNEEYLSPRFKEMFGYADHEMENTPEAWQKIAFQEDLPGMFEKFQKHVESKGKTSFNSVVRYRHKNGKTIWVRCNGKVVSWSDEGAPLRAIGCHVDITEEKERELSLQQAIAERDVLLKEVHHRVKNNLQLVLSLARLKNAKNQITIQNIENSIRSVANAYEAIYSSDRIDEINMNSYIKNVCNPVLSENNIQFNYSCPDIYKDIDYLIPIGLIISELIQNSIKHAFAKDDKKIDLSIACENDKIFISFKDNGVGFNSDFMQDKNHKSSFGVYIMKALIRQQGGDISFKNNQGAQIDIVLNS